MASGCAGTLAHFAEARMRAADSVAALRPWAWLLRRLGRAFPLALLVLLLSGAYLVHRGWTWRSGWIDASLVGVALLFLNGAGLVRARGRALGRALGGAGDGELTPELRRLVVAHPAGIASWVNTGRNVRAASA